MMMMMMMIVKKNPLYLNLELMQSKSLAQQKLQQWKQEEEKAFFRQGGGRGRTGIGIGSCWDSTKNCGVRGRNLRKCTVRRRSTSRRTISRKNRNMKLLILLTMTCNSTCEEQIPIISNVKKRVAIFHVQDWILEIAAVVRFFCNLNHWIFAWWVQEHCKPPWKSEIKA